MKLFSSLLGTMALFLVTTSTFGTEPFQVTPLPEARNMHGSVVVRNYLFVMGGDTPTGFTNEVHMARINSDRTLGPWLESKSMPASLIYIGSSVVEDNSVIYVCGGQQVEDTENPAVYLKEDNNKVYWSRMGTDTILADWQESDPWPSQQSLGAAAVIHNGRLYIVGGGETESQVVRSDVYSAPINRVDGSLGTWREESSLPTPLWFHDTVVHEERIYTAGGRSAVANENAVTDVYAASIQGDATLGQWEAIDAPVQIPVSSAAGCATDQFLFLFCGMTGEGELAQRIQFASFSGEGLGKWSDSPTMMLAKYYASAAFSESARAIYITGGRSTTFYRDTNRIVYCYSLRKEAVESAEDSATKFLELADAAALAGNERRGMLLFFYSNRMVMSESLLRTLNNSNTFFSRIGSYVPASIDATANPEFAKKYQVVRVPTIVLLDESGAYQRSTSGLLSEQEIINFIYSE